MKSRIFMPLTLMVIAASMMFFSQVALADDLADLKATHQKLNNAWNTGDLDTFFEIWQDGGIWLPASQAFPVVTNSAIGKQMFGKWLETHFSRSQWYKVDYRVIGDTGLVWGVTTNTTFVKATGLGKRTFEKETLVFVKSDGKWKGVMSHSTPIPTEAEIY
jgi:uncharacterized protein (TIGR02246 family)